MSTRRADSFSFAYYVSVLTALAAALSLAPVTATAQDAAALTFCVGAASLPMSSEVGSPPGYDVEIARAIADDIGRQAHFTWLDPGEDFEQAVRDGRCNAALGVIVNPGPMAIPPDLAGLTLTTPYYQAGFVLVRHPDAPPLRTLEEASDVPIGVEAESIANFRLRQSGRKVHVFFDYEAVIREVEEGHTTYGYIWGPVAAWVLRGRVDVVIAPEFESSDRWNFALAVRKSDDQLLRALNESIRKLTEEGFIPEIFRPYRIPYVRP
jgi:polar amino acid transport system substrate-binding protein